MLDAEELKTLWLEIDRSRTMPDGTDIRDFNLGEFEDWFNALSKNNQLKVAYEWVGELTSKHWMPYFMELRFPSRPVKVKDIHHKGKSRLLKKPPAGTQVMLSYLVHEWMRHWKTGREHVWDSYHWVYLTSKKIFHDLGIHRSQQHLIWSYLTGLDLVVTRLWKLKNSDYPTQHFSFNRDSFLSYIRQQRKNFDGN